MARPDEREIAAISNEGYAAIARVWHEPPTSSLNWLEVVFDRVAAVRRDNHRQLRLQRATFALEHSNARPSTEAQARARELAMRVIGESEVKRIESDLSAPYVVCSQLCDNIQYHHIYKSNSVRIIKDDKCVATLCCQAPVEYPKWDAFVSRVLLSRYAELELVKRSNISIDDNASQIYEIVVATNDRHFRWFFGKSYNELLEETHQRRS